MKANFTFNAFSNKQAQVIFNTYCEVVYKMALRLTGNKLVAEEKCIDVLVDYMAALQKGIVVQNKLAFMYGCMVRKCADYWRSNSRDTIQPAQKEWSWEDPILGEINIERLMDSKADFAMICSYVEETFTPREAAIFMAMITRGLSNIETAGLFDTSANTISHVKSKIRKGLERDLGHIPLIRKITSQRRRRK